METSEFIIDYTEKVNKLHKIAEELTEYNVAVAFSGGVDSSLLLRVLAEHAQKNGTKVHAYTAKTQLQPAADIALAARVAEEIGARHTVVELNELVEAGIINNPTDRCYLCKKYVFGKILEQAGRDGCARLAEGTNADDTLAHRPGCKAVRELGIVSPLVSAGFTKDDVRRLAAEYGISTAQRPAVACLATRFPYDTLLVADKLKKVESAEEYLHGKGFSVVRVRVHDNVARIEVPKDRFDALLRDKEEITAYFRSLGYVYITLDLDGFRSGSMDEA